jgi:prevent-host-death family protein
MDVGVRELKQHLSEYLERAARGELIRVTERGRPKAMLGPVPGQRDLSTGIAEGWIRVAAPNAPLPARRVPGRARIADVLDDDREP